MYLPPDPLQGLGIAGFGARLRRGSITAEFVTAQFLARIAALEPKLGAYAYVASGHALEAARQIDRALQAGIDFGPLMGVPVAIKDLFTVDGMPQPKAGSHLDISDLIEPEGSFIRRLKRAGCVILGMTQMAELAFGLVNLKHRPPWNPWDARTQRMPGGSSSGSAVAMAAGLCAFSVGTDTGGSVRNPASLCGVFGFKTSHGTWPTDGMFPLSTTLDTIGILTATAQDAALVYSALSDVQIPAARWPLKGVRLGKPRNHYYDEMSPDVDKCVQRALAILQEAGVEIIDIEVPEASEIDRVFFPILAAELLAHLGVERVVSGEHVLDPLVWSRIKTAFNYPASSYIRLRGRQAALCRIAKERMRGLDAWVTPTTLDTATARANYNDVETLAAWTRRSVHNTRLGNLFGQCGSSIPIQMLGSELPVGLQIMCSGGNEQALLSLSQGIEAAVGLPSRPDVAPFLQEGTAGQ